jgi:fused signal recognition particle receptor
MDLVDIIVLVAVVLLVGLAGLGVTRRARRRRGPGPTTRPPQEPVEARPLDAAGPPSAVAGEPAEAVEPAVAGEPAEAVEPVSEPAPAVRFRERLARTRNVLATSVADLFGRGVSDEAWDGLEEALIGADVGVAAATEIVEQVRRRTREEGATTREAVEALLADELRAILTDADRSLHRRDHGLSVWLVTGVNGTGKTTTIGKLAAVEPAMAGEWCSRRRTPSVRRPPSSSASGPSEPGPRWSARKRAPIPPASRSRVWTPPSGLRPTCSWSTRRAGSTTSAS